MIEKDTLNKIFLRDFDYFFKKYTTHSTIENYGHFISNIFNYGNNYKIFTNRSIEPDEIDLVSLEKEILYNLLVQEITIINTKEFLEDLIKFLQDFWRKINCRNYIFKFAEAGSKIIMNIFENDGSSQATFQVKDQKAIQKFIIEIINVLYNYHDKYYNTTIYEGGIGHNVSIPVCLTKKEMKKILKDYADFVYELDYRR